MREIVYSSERDEKRRSVIDRYLRVTYPGYEVHDRGKEESSVVEPEEADTVEFVRDPEKSNVSSAAGATHRSESFFRYGG